MNKFFNENDVFITKIGNIPIHPKWWSRGYEFAFALDYIKKNEKVMYASGRHALPFKSYLKSKTKECIDFDEEKTTKGEIDKIFCISWLEHQPQKKEILQEFYNLLSKNGKVILTIDYPLVKPNEIVDIAQSTGFMPVGECNYNPLDKKNIKGEYLNLKCFSMILEKKKTHSFKKEKEEKTRYKTKNIETYETKNNTNYLEA